MCPSPAFEDAGEGAYMTQGRAQIVGDGVGEGFEFARDGFKGGGGLGHPPFELGVCCPELLQLVVLCHVPFNHLQHVIHASTTTLPHPTKAAMLIKDFGEELLHIFPRTLVGLDRKSTRLNSSH